MQGVRCKKPSERGGILLKYAIGKNSRIKMFEQEDEWISKTQMKKQMNGLQDLGMELTRLSNDTLKKIGLDEDLYEAVVTYKKITSNGALKRQAQFIGRLMRDTDPAPIEAFLAKLRGDDAAHNAFLQRVERARMELLADDGALTQFMSDFPHADAGKLRTLIRNTKKEQEQNKPPKNFRALFQELKTVMENGDAEI
ncbi:ribosome-associated protein [Neisseria meningitidis]|nr:ribosome-associated protein [Neisseria meningitidis]